ncbi:BlaI/MecI/CopY family transcriptional regulator [Anaerolentibacter hominis]|uniref:BlaI/MecI/CopY family transcriptional regulator n=1 Tax=Anaerolentibacter hominis TaxID=3079009 RepID=UPI0031B8357C
MNLADKISNAELEVMKILWRVKQPVSFTNLRLELQSTKNWGKSTINTLVRRLAEKGVITSEKREVMYYSPNITEAEYIETETQGLIDKLYGGNAKNFIAALCHGSKLSENDIDELREYFNKEEIR